MAMWKDSLKIGVPLIDSEHKELCDRIDRLFAACSQGKGRDEIMKTVEFLESYTIKHFSDEEKLQRSRPCMTFLRRKLRISKRTSPSTAQPSASFPRPIIF